VLRVFKTKTFNRWARKVLSDAALCTAAQEIARGEYEADLGGGVCKKRIAIAGQGKRGGTRTLVAKQHKDALFFIAGRQKSDPGTDFTDTEQEAAKIIATGLQAASAQKLDELAADGTIKEICNGKDEEPQ
jgi:hypothetical protein